MYVHSWQVDKMMDGRFWQHIIYQWVSDININIATLSETL